MSVDYTFLIEAVTKFSPAYGEDVADMASHIEQLQAELKKATEYGLSLHMSLSKFVDELEPQPPESEHE